jgi:hypothetical protein
MSRPTPTAARSSALQVSSCASVMTPHTCPASMQAVSLTVFTSSVSMTVRTHTSPFSIIQSTHYTRIPVVCSSAFEAEYAGLFATDCAAAKSPAYSASNADEQTTGIRVEWAAAKSPAYSASNADEQTTGIRVEWAAATRPKCLDEHGASPTNLFCDNECAIGSVRHHALHAQNVEVREYAISLGPRPY